IGELYVQSNNVSTAPTIAPTMASTITPTMGPTMTLRKKPKKKKKLIKPEIQKKNAGLYHKSVREKRKAIPQEC
ncbi:2549_t:CDS:2, partial [Racocetra persica]